MNDTLNYYRDIEKSLDINKRLSFEQSGIGDLVVEEYYSTNLNSKKNEVRLDFHQVSDDPNLENPVLTLRYNLDTMNTTKIKVNDNRISSSLMIMNITNFHNSNKEYFKKHSDEAKRFFIKQLGSRLSFDVRKSLDEGSYILYSDVFEQSSQPTYQFKYTANDYSVIDAYCMDPKCLCNEVILYIMKDTEEEEEGDVFVVKYNFDQQTTVIEKSSIPNERIDSIMNVLKDDHQFKTIIMKHYDYMKIVGEEALKPKKPIHKKKIGRNEPCPCGSGKKYKKCCL